MKILMGYIFGAFLMTFGMFIFNMMIVEGEVYVYNDAIFDFYG